MCTFLFESTFTLPSFVMLLQVRWCDMQVLELYTCMRLTMPKQSSFRAFCEVLRRQWACAGNWGTNHEYLLTRVSGSTVGQDVARGPQHPQQQTDSSTRANVQPHTAPSATSNSATSNRVLARPTNVYQLSHRKLSRTWSEYTKFVRKMQTSQAHGLEVLQLPLDCAACSSTMQSSSFDLCFKCIQLQSATRQEVVNKVHPDICA